MKKKIQFNGEAKRAIDLALSSFNNLFITGKAGTGKSTLLEHIVERLEDVVVLAPTGIAAINVGGETIHSFFRLKPGHELDEAIHLKLNKNRLDKYRSLKTILIDEISMLRADILDAIDVFLKRARNSNEYFGGVRVIFFGDLYQLPPVVSNDGAEAFYSKYESPWFFSAKIFESPDLFTESISIEKIELDKIYRQSEANFISILNGIRNNNISTKQLSELNSLVDLHFEEDKNKWINLVTTNYQALSINESKLSEIKSEEIEFNSLISGKIGNIRPNDDIVKVKKGAQVMFIVNDPEKRWVNGSIGEIVEIEESGEEGSNTLYVLLENGKTVEVNMHTWPIAKYHFVNGKFTREEIGSYTQIPLKLAWAITIHKSQGKSFKNVIIDLGRGSFAHGQCYVALSRCISMKSLVLRQAITRDDIIIDKYVEQFH